MRGRPQALAYLTMTAQNRDTVYFRGREYAVAGCDGLGLFEPCHYGLQPLMVTTACWRGYRCRYAIAPEGLVLDSLVLTLNERDAEHARRGLGPLLFDQVPVECPDDEADESSFAYEGLRVPIRFTGRMLLGSGVIHEPTPPGGAHPAFRFRDVVELVLDAGRLLQALDRSGELAAARARMAQARYRAVPVTVELRLRVGWVVQQHDYA